MKRTVEMDTDEISDRLSKVRGRLHIVRLACDGLGGDDGGGSLIASMIFEIEEELKEISRKFHPPACEIDHIRRQVEFGIADLVKVRQEAEREETQSAFDPIAGSRRVSTVS